MSETSQSPRTEQRQAVRWRRTRLGIVIAAATVSFLAVLLVLAAWRDDHLINSDRGVTSAEVLSAGTLRSAVIFVTPDGETHNPKTGVLYPTKLTVGERINVEYRRSDPDLVRVAGRDARVAVIPALSVIVVAWAIAIPALWLLGSPPTRWYRAVRARLRGERTRSSRDHVAG
ncbi:DUF3592 domain-containing protein [Nocardia sp. NPDC004340]|uniref:DUF3592 domain-containing protein n=1 Tax=Nocardia sp. CA-136227 TaxID=3239979 RepID=UPI003D954B85